jgi:hypothetical protein
MAVLLMSRLASVCIRLSTRLVRAAGRLTTRTKWLVTETRKMVSGRRSHTASEKGRYSAVHLAASNGSGETILYGKRKIFEIILRQSAQNLITFQKTYEFF